MRTVASLALGPVAHPWMTELIKCRGACLVADDWRPSRRLANAVGRQRAGMLSHACCIEETAYDSYKGEMTRFVRIAACCSICKMEQRSEGSTA